MKAFLVKNYLDNSNFLITVFCKTDGFNTYIVSKILCKKNNENVLTYKYKNDKLDLILLERFLYE